MVLVYIGWVGLRLYRDIDLEEEEMKRKKVFELIVKVTMYISLSLSLDKIYSIQLSIDYLPTYLPIPLPLCKHHYFAD